MKELTLQEVLELEVDAGGLYLDMKMANEIYDELIKNHRAVPKEAFDALVQLRWLAYCRSN